ncbi:hypothetical protein SBRY_50277 [Actinacidiphila bryophytorum]|uniref:Uncharacterized protein n=1 Tax=Actinacidiphila bryophytorum TaxID=1436133 RepID=A0A9W4MJ66_9ACTN|nr:hypothetical protein SBRY_50277 [Actinacidiphila bryophytorum]
MAFCSLPLRSTCTCRQRYCCATSESLGPAASEGTLLYLAPPLHCRTSPALNCLRGSSSLPRLTDFQATQKTLTLLGVNVYLSRYRFSAASERHSVQLRDMERLPAGLKPCAAGTGLPRKVAIVRKQPGQRGFHVRPKRSVAVPSGNHLPTRLHSAAAPDRPRDPPSTWMCPGSPSVCGCGGHEIRTREGLPPTRFPTGRTRVRPGPGKS